MKESLLKWLVCPLTQEDLQLTVFEYDQNKYEIKEGRLKSVVSSNEYPIINYIPVFVPNSGNIYPEFFNKYQKQFFVNPFSKYGKKLSHNEGLVQKGFGYEWRKYKTVSEKIDYDFVMAGNLTEQFYADKLILDAGCGFGRHLNIIRRFSGTEVVGVDFSIAVLSAMEIVGFFPNVHIVQADLFRLPFRLQTFDLIYSWGVLHHTPDTKTAFFRLTPYVKPGGIFSLKVYRNIFPPAHQVQKFIRFFTSRLPLGLLRFLCFFAYPFHFLNYRLGFRHIPIWSHLCRFFFKFSEDWPVSLNDTFDWWHPRYNHYHKTAEVKQWFEAMAFNDITVAPDLEVAWGVKGFRD